MKVIILDAFWDSLGMLPFLFVVYLLIELLENKYGSHLRSRVAHSHKWGPLVGSLLGCFPQCGFSVIGASLYTKRLITIGTTIAIFMATSDEAVPVILAQPEHIDVVVPLIVTKFLLGVFFGYFFDKILFRHQELAKHAHEPQNGDWPKCEVVNNVVHHGCCGHAVAKEKTIHKFFIHPLRHTISVFIFIFAVSIVLNFLIFRFGTGHLGDVLMKNSIFQPLLCALVGLIPNCAASVVITQIYLVGGISFGGVVAGLSASGGLGILVLFRENKNVTDTFKIIGLLFLSSALSGIIIQTLWG